MMSFQIGGNTDH